MHHQGRPLKSSFGRYSFQFKKGRNGNPIKNNEAVLIKVAFNNFWGIVLVVSITVELPQQINLSFS